MGTICCKPRAASREDDFPPTPQAFEKPYAVQKYSPEPKPRADDNVEERMKKSQKRRHAHIREVYKIGRTLGTGGFAVVKLAMDRKTGDQYACKIMTLPRDGEQVSDNENSRADVFKEIEILCGLEHNNVVFLKEFFQEENKVYLITELLTGGELLDAVLERGTYSEADARLCFRQLLEGIAYLHSRNVAHRDLKLENLLLATPDDITHIKIADFGLAKLAQKDTYGSNMKMETICGTPQYVAPEVIQGVEGNTYGNAVDMWSAGVVLFILLGGYPPFHSENEPEMFKMIRQGEFSFDEPVWDSISEIAKDLIRKLLQVDPDRRLSASECLGHPWITGVVSSTPLGATHENLKKNYRKKFRKAVNVVMTINKMKRLAIAEEDSAKTDEWKEVGQEE